MRRLKKVVLYPREAMEELLKKASRYFVEHFAMSYEFFSLCFFILPPKRNSAQKMFQT